MHAINPDHRSPCRRTHSFSEVPRAMVTPLKGPPVLVELDVPLGPAALEPDVQSNKSEISVSTMSHSSM
jgi:hypothetical protein